jgi:hypothetical protein
LTRVEWLGGEKHWQKAIPSRMIARCDREVVETCGDVGVAQVAIIVGICV